MISFPAFPLSPWHWQDTDHLTQAVADRWRDRLGCPRE